MARAALIGAVVLGLLAAPLVVGGQRAGGAYRVAWLAPAPNADNLGALRDGLRALGYVESGNLVIEPRYAEGRGDGLVGAAAELAQTRPDIIVTDGSAAASVLKRAAGSIPVVFVSGDPVGMGLVPSLSRPGGTMTGLAIVSTELNVKRLELVREGLPQVSRIGVLYEPRQLTTIVPPIEAGARALALHVTRLPARVAGDIDTAFATAVRERVAVIVPAASACSMQKSGVW